MRPLHLAAGALALTAALASSANAQEAKPQPGEADFRALYKELVEINTTASVGSCTKAAEAMKAHLVAAGYPESDLHVVVPPDHAREGNLIATYAGSDPKLKPVLLLAHIDVVEANRADWVRDPFKLSEEGGYFYGRRAEDDKAMAAMWADLMVRVRKENYKPKRGLKMALTCGEEGGFPLDGVDWLIENHRDMLDAEFALNEGGGGHIDHVSGKYVFNGVLAAEKLYQDYTLDVTNPGGHSSRPTPDNAIYHLAAALKKIEAYRFPFEANAATTGFLNRMADIEGGERGADMRAFAKSPTADSEAAIRLTKDIGLNGILHTTCVATEVNGGHAPNALPQRATANVNCRIMPGHDPAEIRAALERAVGDPQVKITFRKAPKTSSPPPPLTPAFMGPLETVTKQMFPGVPVVTFMQTGATDGSSLNAAGIPAYGLSGMFEDEELAGLHGLNERMAVKSLLEGREFLYRLVKLYAAGK